MEIVTEASYNMRRKNELSNSFNKLYLHTQNTNSRLIKNNTKKPLLIYNIYWDCFKSFLLFVKKLLRLLHLKLDLLYQLCLCFWLRHPGLCSPNTALSCAGVVMQKLGACFNSVQSLLHRDAPWERNDIAVPSMGENSLDLIFCCWRIQQEKKD